MTTTPDDIYRSIVEKVGVALVANGIAANRVSLTERPALDAGAEVFVQVRAAGGSFRVPQQVSKLTRERVEVTTWIRQQLDPGVEQTIMLSQESTSILSRIDISRGALQGNYLDGQLVTPLRLISVGSPVVATGGDGSVRVTDVYQCDYEYGSPMALRMVWSPTAPTTLVGATQVSLEDAVSIQRASTGEEYLWCLQPSTGGSLGFWGEGGRTEWYSNTNEPPTGPLCGTVTIGSVTYRRWRSPYASEAQAAIFRVREV